MRRKRVCLCAAVILAFWFVQTVAAFEEDSKQPSFVSIGQGDLKISGFAQALYRYYEVDSQNDSFSLPRVRIKFDGQLRPELAYRIQIDVAASEDVLRDAYIKYTKCPSANVIVGQFFIPFSEEQLYPTSNLEFILVSRDDQCKKINKVIFA